MAYQGMRLNDFLALADQRDWGTARTAAERNLWEQANLPQVRNPYTGPTSFTNPDTFNMQQYADYLGSQSRTQQDIQNMMYLKAQQMGLSPAQVDQQMGWGSGVTQNWINSNIGTPSAGGGFVGGIGSSLASNGAVVQPPATSPAPQPATPAPSTPVPSAQPTPAPALSAANPYANVMANLDTMRGALPQQGTPSPHFQGLFRQGQVNDPTVGFGGQYTYANSSSPVNYLGLFQRTNPYWGYATNASNVGLMPMAPSMPQYQQMLQDKGFGAARQAAEMDLYKQQFNPWNSYRESVYGNPQTIQDLINQRLNESGVNNLSPFEQMQNNLGGLNGGGG